MVLSNQCVAVFIAVDVDSVSAMPYSISQSTNSKSRRARLSLA